MDCCGRGSLKEVLLENGWEKLPTWECLVCVSSARSIPVRVRERHQNGMEEIGSGTHVEK